jgi:probable HAF family extracellular repeat protein
MRKAVLSLTVLTASKRMTLTLLAASLVAMALILGLGVRTAETQTTTSASTPTYYKVQDLGTLGENYRYSRAQGINDSGQVVGYSLTNDGSYHAFLYDSADSTTQRMQDLGTFGGSYSYAYDINDSGQVVGMAQTSIYNEWYGDSESHAFLYDSANGMKDLNDLTPEDSGWTLGQATAINSSGEIVTGSGQLLTPVTTGTPATYEVQDLPILISDYSNNATDINDSGKVVGRALKCTAWGYFDGNCYEWDENTFLYDSATQQMQNLGPYRSPTGINDSDNDSSKVVAGQYLYDSATQQWQDLGTVGDYSYSRATDINDPDQVVGAACKTLLHSGTDGYWYYTSCHGALKEGGQPMIDLNTLIPPDSGWTIDEATAISSNGKIAATGHKDGVGTHAFLLTPTNDIPAPKITSPYDTDGSFSVSGSAIAASTVELFEGTTSKGTAKADSSTGAWSIDLSGVSEGPHTYSAKAKDESGNTSSASDSVTVTVDKSAPTGTVSINNGASRTRSRSVTLTLSATDPSPGSGVTDMRISNTQSGLSSAPWEAYSTSKAWTLTSGQGTKTVYVQYRDGAGNDSAVVTDTIRYNR